MQGANSMVPVLISSMYPTTQKKARLAVWSGQGPAIPVWHAAKSQTIIAGDSTAVSMMHNQRLAADAVHVREGHVPHPGHVLHSQRPCRTPDAWTISRRWKSAPTFWTTKRCLAPSAALAITYHNLWLAWSESATEMTQTGQTQRCGLQAPP